MNTKKVVEEGIKEYCPITVRRYWLMRDEDVSGVSGTGVVAYIVEFMDGTTVLRWRNADGSTGIYKNIDQVEKIHGHEGRTRIVPVNEFDIHSFALSLIEAVGEEILEVKFQEEIFEHLVTGKEPKLNYVGSEYYPEVMLAFAKLRHEQRKRLEAIISEVKK